MNQDGSKKEVNGTSRNLTKAEEQVMQAVWQHDKAYLKDVVEAMPEPRPHSNTVATLLKILIDKGYVKAETAGRNHLYSAGLKKRTIAKQPSATL